jgi:hypothetical protein
MVVSLVLHCVAKGYCLLTTGSPTSIGELLNRLEQLISPATGIVVKLGNLRPTARAKTFKDHRASTVMYLALKF